MRSQFVTSKKHFSPLVNRFSVPFGLALALTLSCAGPTLADDAPVDYSIKIRQVHFVGQPLDWVGETPPSEQESRDLWEAMGGRERKNFSDIAASLEDFIKTHPQSPWRPGLENRLANYYKDAGYFSVA
jgi:hypothetical protein